jgi:hypothetical protein
MFGITRFWHFQYAGDLSFRQESVEAALAIRHYRIANTQSEYVVALLNA